MLDIEKMVREGMSFAEITGKMNEEIAAAQKKVYEEKKAAEKEATRSKQLESARKAFKEAGINYMNALGLLEDCNEEDLQEIEKLFDISLAATEKGIKINKLPNGGTEIKAKFNGLGDLFSDNDIIKNFVRGLI